MKLSWKIAGIFSLLAAVFRYGAEHILNIRSACRGEIAAPVQKSWKGQQAKTKCQGLKVPENKRKSFRAETKSTQRSNKKTAHILNTVSPPISIFSRSYFVSRHFMIQSFKIFASIIFSIYYDNIMTIIVSYIFFLFSTYN